MKIQYRSIAGQLVPEEWRDSCECCCFDFDERPCFPYSVLDCNSTIFEKTETDIFKL
jgi:hypothetical protein